jgi:hypothetical protein
VEAAAVAVVEAEDANVAKYPNLGIELTIDPTGWVPMEEASPMPNVAMVTMQKEEYADKQPQTPGEIPVVLLSIEDISLEGLNIDEFREKSKAMAMYQMTAMTQGMFQPTIDKDGSLAVGPFTHCLEYSQITPFFQMKVMNLITVTSGFAYIFQIMAGPADFEKTKREVMGMARTMKLTPRAVEAAADAPFLSVVTAGAAVHAASSWQLVSSSATANPVFVFETASTTKAESITVYDNSLEGGFAEMDKLLGQPQQEVGRKAAVAATYKDSGDRNVTVVRSEAATAVLAPKMKYDTVTATAVVAELLDSLVLGANAGVTKAQSRYVNGKMGFAFDVRPDSKLMESRLGERTVVYAPFGIPNEQSTEEGPIMTVRSGNPSNDPDCRNSIGEWYAHIKETSEAENITEVKKDAINGRECVTFTNREMAETGPGQKEERTAKVVIFLEGITTTMIRWEAASGAFRKHERFINAVNESFTLE